MAKKVAVLAVNPVNGCGPVSYTHLDVYKRQWLGYAFICLGVVDCFWEGHSLLFWTIGFGGFHILYGILFYLHYERKRS